ncbi:MAG: T9SS type A sorting domain-containing protein, partial [Candidatus Paceibacterota bacterium]
LSQLSDNFSISGNGEGFVSGLGYSTASVTYYDSVATNPALFKKALSNAPNKSSSLLWSVNRGILALVRGQGTEGLGGTYASANQPSAFAADATGTLNQGTLNDYILGANTNGTSFNLVGNPFAAPINIKLLKSNGGNPLYANNNATGVGNTIYVYNPYKNAGVSSTPSQEVRGGLDAYTNDGNTDIIIPAFGAFFIQAKALGNVIRFDETVKTVSGIPVAVMGNGPATAKLNLEIVNNKGSWDDLKLRWDNKANTAGTDSYDGLKLNNELFDFYSLSSDNRKLCIDSRSDSFNREEIIPLGISTNVTGNSFWIRVAQYELPVNMRVYLRDKLLKTEKLLSGTGDEYAFSITTDTATRGDNRFELAVKISQQSIPAPDVSSDAFKVLPNPFKDLLVISLGSNMVSAAGNTHVRVVDLLGRVIKTVTAGPNTSLIKLDTHALASGIYVVEVANDKNQITKQVIKQ